MAKRRIKKKFKQQLKSLSLLIGIIIMFILVFQVAKYYLIASEELTPISEKKRVL